MEDDLTFAQQQQPTNAPEKIKLTYADIIKITSPSNKEYNNKSFFIHYVDEKHIFLLDIANSNTHKLNVDENGNLTDESIEEIILLSRSEEKGFVRNNGYDIGTLVNVYLKNGVDNSIVTGVITDIQEDQVEIKTQPYDVFLYIDFEYKGIHPEKHLPIYKMVKCKKNIDENVMINDVFLPDDNYEKKEEEEEEEQMPSIEYNDLGESVVLIPEKTKPDKNVKEILKDIFLKANEIEFGVEEDVITQIVEINDRDKKYPIEVQVNDLMDELLSTIPNVQRTKKIMDEIHRLIERYKELRQQFSVFDKNNNIVDYVRINNNHKPLVDYLMNKKNAPPSSLSSSPYCWMKPVVSNKKKIYSAEDDNENDEKDNDVFPDVVNANQSQELMELKKVQDNFFENKEQGDVIKYHNMRVNTHPFFEPIVSPSKNLNDEYLTTHPVFVNVDAVVDNDDNHKSTVVSNNKISYKKYKIQRYNVGETMMQQELLKTGKKTYKRKNITDNDAISIKSFIVFPKQVIQFSTIDLPSTDILTRSSLSANPMLLFEILKKNTTIEQHIIDDMTNEIDFEKNEKETNVGFLSKTKEYILDNSLFDHPNKFGQYLNTIIPNSRMFIRLVQPYLKNKMSLHDVVVSLEPYMIYSNNLTYGHYKDIRYYLKERLQEYNLAFKRKFDDFSLLRNFFNFTNNARNKKKQKNTIHHLLMNHKNIYEIFNDSYKLMENMTSTEIVSKMYFDDSVALFSNLLRYMMTSLVIPEQFLNAVLDPPSSSSMDDLEKIKAMDCSLKFLTKKYISISQLQKDNGKEDIFYDKSLDDTPYEILGKYKNEQKNMLNEDFVEFLAENLVAKHNCPRHKSLELAKILVIGKKGVKNGEFAVLETTNVDDDNNSTTHLQYYQRKKNVWVRDESVSNDTFINNNTLFCNMNNNCFKNQTTKTCDANSETKKRSLKNNDYLLKEIDKRYTFSTEQNEKDIDEMIAKQIANIVNFKKLIYFKQYKANNFAYDFGKMAEKQTVVESLFVPLREKILSQDGFVKKQSDIVRFATNYTREPMIAELNESPHWLYCKDTNTKLLPSFLVSLAKTFVMGGDYQSELNKICRTNGIISDDGDSIVDKYSGYVIRKIDFSEEEGFDEYGFKVSTHDIIEKDLSVVIEEALKKDDTIFNNETSNFIYGVLKTLARNIGVNTENIEEFVMRISLETISKAVVEETKYTKQMEKKEKATGKKQMPYVQYKNQTTILIVSSVFLIGLQTATPSFKPKITAPGCVRSFSGFPMDGNVEDSGVNYVACVLNLSKSSSEPWDSIKKMPLTIIVSSIKRIATEYLINRPDIEKLYILKREYLALNPETYIPKEHKLEKWLSFLPPIIPFTMSKNMTHSNNEHKEELLKSMKDGSHHQRKHISSYHFDINQQSFKMIEIIHSIVSKKELILKTSANVPFIQNSCCNNKNHRETALQYFIGEDVQIETSLKIIKKLSLVLKMVKELSDPSIFFHNKNTTISYPLVKSNHNINNIYKTFIYYCKYDFDVSLPEEYKSICPEKPKGYNPQGTLEEKKELFKTSGKQFTENQLMHLMQVVFKNNIVNISFLQDFSQTEFLVELMKHLDLKNCNTIETPLRNHVLNVLSKYNPNTMTNEDNTETEHLKNYLAKCNQHMFITIMEFLNKFGNLTKKKSEDIQGFLKNICVWNIDRSSQELHYEEGLYTIQQFMLNAVVCMSKVFPEIIYNNTDINKIPGHWDLSSIHETDVSKFVKEYYQELQMFKSDDVILKLLLAIQQKTMDINTFMKNIPVYTPIHKYENTFYSLFDKKTIYLLFSYCFYSVLYEYVLLSNDRDLLKEDKNKMKEVQKQNIKISFNVSEQISVSSDLHTEPDTNDEINEEYKNIDDVRIDVGNQEEFKKRVANLMIAMLNIHASSKKMTDEPYEHIINKVKRSKKKEKNTITEFFKNMSNEERKTEYMLKNAKLGKWSVGLENTIFKYNQKTYDKERETMGELFKEGDENVFDVDNADVSQRGVNDLMMEDETLNELMHDGEGNDISNLDVDYSDGAGGYSDDENDF